jgi:hypothetical protein
VNKPFVRKLQEYGIDSCKEWLCDTKPISIKKGLAFIVSNTGSFGPLYDDQIFNLNNKLGLDLFSPRFIGQDLKSSVETEDIARRLPRLIVAFTRRTIVLDLDLNL